MVRTKHTSQNFFTLCKKTTAAIALAALTSTSLQAQSGLENSPISSSNIEAHSYAADMAKQ